MSLSGVERLSISRRLKIYYFHRESNQCFLNCLLYGVCLYLGVSIMRGFFCSQFGMLTLHSLHVQGKVFLVFFQGTDCA